MIGHSEDTSNTQKELFYRQIKSIQNDKEIYVRRVEQYYKEYLILKKQLDLLTLQTPVNYLTDGKIVNSLAQGK